MRRTFLDDVFGGVTSAIVMLPLALAFGVASGLGPVAGIYGAVTVGFFAAAFGGTPAQISGPTGPMTIAMAAIVTLHAHDLATAFTIVMLAGLIQISLGFLRVGRFVGYTPYSVISGFMTGIGAIIIILQVVTILGAEPIPGGSAYPDCCLAGGHCQPQSARSCCWVNRLGYLRFLAPPDTTLPAPCAGRLDDRHLHCVLRTQRSTNHGCDPCGPALFPDATDRVGLNRALLGAGADSRASRFHRQSADLVDSGFPNPHTPQPRSGTRGTGTRQSGGRYSGRVAGLGSPTCHRHQHPGRRAHSAGGHPDRDSCCSACCSVSAGLPNRFRSLFWPAF